VSERAGIAQPDSELALPWSSRRHQVNGCDRVVGTHTLYVQAADYLAAKIASGDLAPGSRLPAERDLADQWGIAYQTVRRTMRELRERGLVTSVVGKGTFVRPEGERPASSR